MAVTGLLTPDARLRVFSDLGVVLAGAKLNTYVAGTPSTPLATYSDSALTTPNTNPVVASAGGLFGPIYLTPGVAYKLLLTDSAGVTVPGWPQDNVMMPANNTLAAGTGISLVTLAGVTTITNTSVSAPTISTNGFRLTLESGVPVSDTDQLAKTALFCTPSGRGNRIDCYDASGVPTTLTSGQFSIAIPSTTGQMYDVFVYNNAGVATLELLAWTNDTTRAVAIVLSTTGTWTKSTDNTRRLVGCVRTTAVAGQTESSRAKRFVWNVDNQTDWEMKAADATGSWSYNTATIRQVRATAANQVEFIVGIAGMAVRATHTATVGNDSAALQPMQIGIGLDSTTAYATNNQGNVIVTGPTANEQRNGVARAELYPAVGYHTLTMLERGSGTGGTTWYGTTTYPGAATLLASVPG